MLNKFPTGYVATYKSFKENKNFRTVATTTIRKATTVTVATSTLTKSTTITIASITTAITTVAMMF